MENKSSKGKAPIEKFAASSSSAAAASPALAETYRSRRFRVELSPDEATIVDWRQLCEEDDRKNAAVGADPALDQAMEIETEDNQPPKQLDGLIKKIENLYVDPFTDKGGEYVFVPDSDQYDTEDSFIDDTELDDYFTVDGSTTKYNGYYVNRGKLEMLDSPPNLSLEESRRTEATDLPNENENAYILTERANDGAFSLKSYGRNAPVDKKRSSSSLEYYGKPHQKAKHLKNNSSVNTDFPSSSNLQNQNIAMPIVVNDGPIQSRDPAKKSRRHQESRNSYNEGKAGSLDSAIYELENLVTQFKKEKKMLDAREANVSQIDIIRSTHTVKHQLAKVVRFADIQGKATSTIFFDRLMKIFVDIMEPESLKNRLNEMVELGQLKKQENAIKFQKIKGEVIEMIQTWMASSNLMAPPTVINPSDDLHMINIEMGDKLYKLYDLHVEGMGEEQKKAQTKKLYEELAGLWPAGYMHRDIIRNALTKAKNRKRAAHKRKRQMAEDESYIQRSSKVAHNSIPRLEFLPCSNKGKGPSNDSWNGNNNGRESRKRKRAQKLSFEYDFTPKGINEITHVIALPVPNLTRLYKEY